MDMRGLLSRHGREVARRITRQSAGFAPKNGWSGISGDRWRSESVAQRIDRGANRVE